jgi:hypothetical protein
MEHVLRQCLIARGLNSPKPRTALRNDRRFEQPLRLP